MRTIFISLALVLSGCTTIKGWFGLDEQKPEPPAVPASGVMSNLGDKIDRSDSKVSAAVSTMVENKTSPSIVEAEGKVALAHLPPPADKDLQEARKRASLADPKVYENEIKAAKVFLAQVEADWKRAEEMGKKNADELKAARDEVTKLKQEIKRVEAEGNRNVWTLTGAGLFVTGVLIGAFLGWKMGLSIIICAPLAGAVPTILDSQYFAWIVGGTLTVTAGLLLWRLFDYIKDKNDEYK